MKDKINKKNTPFVSGESFLPGASSGIRDHLSVRLSRLAGRSTALLAAVILSFASAAMPLTAEAKDKKDDPNKIYGEAIFSADGLEDYAAELEYNKKQPIKTNQVSGWPKGPAVGAAGAIVMDADSGTILYEKNIDKHLYPASITKIMTALLVYENLDLTDTITFSENAIFGIEPGSSNIGMDVGESITVDEALNGLMVASANEVAVALAERVSGSEEAFADLMNKRAEELGCKNTHFVTSNGLHKEDHYTCARDMALIAREAYKYPELIEYMSKMNYHFEKSKKQPDDFWLLNTNDFLTEQIYYEGVIGGKTGYTDQARETLVTYAKRDKVSLICVIMREEPPYEYYDTMDLLEYGFKNFKRVKIAKKETRFLMKSPDFLSSGDDIFGRTASSCRIPEDATLMIPKKSSFSDLNAEITGFTYEQGDGSSGEDPSHILDNGTRKLGVIHYKFNDYEIATADVLFHESEKKDSDKENTVAEKIKGFRSLIFSLAHTGAHGSIYLNILLFLPLILAVSTILCVIFFIRSMIDERNRRDRRRKQRQRAGNSSSQSRTNTLERNRDRTSYRRNRNRDSGSRRSPRSRT